jgi:cyclic pyranopterin phosphate synthase
MGNSLIIDKMKRPLRDLRISVTDRCNFRCSYCMPAEIFGNDYPFMTKNQLLNFDEIERLTHLFVKMGVKKVRLTGGEPLLRPNLPELIQRLQKLKGLEDIALTTNGVLLPKLAQPLKKAGLQRVNISLDALDDVLFRKLNGNRTSVKPVLLGIEAAQKAGLGVKINMVVQKGINENQIIPMAKYFQSRNISIRYIEFMDVGTTNGWDFSKVVSKKEILEKLTEVDEILENQPEYFGEVANTFTFKNIGGTFGIISSVSDSFCSSCTRARLSADGKLFTCLFASTGFDLKEKVATIPDDETLYEVIKSIWENRSDQYSDLRTAESVKHKKKIEMSYIGG